MPLNVLPSSLRPRSSSLRWAAVPSGLMARGRLSSDGGHPKGDLVEGEQSDFLNRGLISLSSNPWGVGAPLSCGKRLCDGYHACVSMCAFIVIAQYSVEKADKSH